MSACFDEGTLQAYADGELDAARAREVAAHTGACAACAAAVNEAADHFALLSSALGSDDAVTVPTAQLRARIDAAIAELQPLRAAQPSAQPLVQHAVQPVASPSFVERLRGFASSLAAGFSNAPRHATAFAGLLVAAVLLATIFFVFRPQSSGPRRVQDAVEIAKVNQPSGASGSASREGGANDSSASDEGNTRAAGAGDVDENGKPRGNGRSFDRLNGNGFDRSAQNRGSRMAAAPGGFVNVNYTRANSNRGVARPGDVKTSEAALLPVEQPYASAAASLKSSIDQQGARLMTPTLRAEYERSLAVVDRAIDASRAAARRDPADKGAQEFLRTAYEDKLELLRTVADQAQIASIGRQ